MQDGQADMDIAYISAMEMVWLQSMLILARLQFLRENMYLREIRLPYPEIQEEVQVHIYILKLLSMVLQ